MKSVILKTFAILMAIATGGSLWYSLHTADKCKELKDKYGNLVETGFYCQLSEIDGLLRRLGLLNKGETGQIANAMEVELLMTLVLLDTCATELGPAWTNDVKCASEKVAKYCRETGSFNGREDWLAYIAAKGVIERYLGSLTNRSTRASYRIG